MENNREEYDQWQDLWDKAVQDGFLDKKETPVESERCDSFFGFPDQHAEEESESEVEAWKRIYGAGEVLHGAGPGDELPDNTTISEVEDDKATLNTNLNTLTKSPNPVLPYTVGKDQTWDSLDHTYTQEDIEELHELKIQLHGLQDRLASLTTKGEGTKRIDKQISNLKERIEELSNSLGQVLPQQMSSQKET